MCKHTERPTSGKVPIRFSTYTIRNGRKGGLEVALRGMSQANMDLGILQETKLTDRIYTRRSAGYSIVAMDAPSQHRGGVAIFHRPAPHFAVEAVQKFGPNVIGFQLATGARQWSIVGCYLALDNTSLIERVVKALRERPKGAELLVAGDLNINLPALECNRREEDITNKIAKEVLEDMDPHFLPRQRRWCWDRRTWRILRKGNKVWSYILGTDRRLFGNVSVRDPRHNSDHYMVLDCLPSASLTEHMRYLGVRKRWLMRLLTKPTQVDKTFAALRRAIPKAQPLAARRNTWISEETWKLVDERVSTLQDPRKVQALKIQLGQVIKAIFAADRKQRADEAGEEVEALVGADSPLIQEAWHRIQGWYKAAVDRAPPPARVTLERITAERVAA